MDWRFRRIPIWVTVCAGALFCIADPPRGIVGLLAGILLTASLFALATYLRVPHPFGGADLFWGSFAASSGLLGLTVSLACVVGLYFFRSSRRSMPFVTAAAAGVSIAQAPCLIALLQGGRI